MFNATSQFHIFQHILKGKIYMLFDACNSCKDKIHPHVQLPFQQLSEKVTEL